MLLITIAIYQLIVETMLVIESRNKCIIENGGVVVKFVKKNIGKMYANHCTCFLSSRPIYFCIITHP